MKRFFNFLLTCTLSTFIIFGSVQSAKAQIIYSLDESEALSKGVTYTEKQTITDDGYLDIHVLEVNLNDPNLALKPMTNQEESGKKENVTNLIDQNGAIAGVNGDYFGMVGSYSATFGPEIKDGEILSASTGPNASAWNYSSFFVKDDNNPFMDYVNFNMPVYVDGKYTMDIFAYNKVTDMVLPIIVSYDHYQDTTQLDDRFSELMKVVVDGDGIITYVSDQGETVNIPEGGYAIVFKTEMPDYYKTLFTVGQSCAYQINCSIDISDVEDGIGGAGQIIKNGQLVDDAGDNVGGYQPRTAVGYSEDGNTAYLVVVDGRGDSIGATHSDMADILLDLGAYNAMHLDGGGSTTMSYVPVGETEAELANSPSDVVQRRVMNGLGVYVDAPEGDITSIEIDSNDSTLDKAPVTLSANAFDEYLRLKDVDQSQIVYSVDPSQGTINNGVLTPAIYGEVTVNASYGDITTSKTIDSLYITELASNQSEVNTLVGGSQELSFFAIDNFGNEIDNVTGLTYEVSPSNLGHFEGNTFVGDTTGTGTIKANYDNVYTYVKASVGYEESPLYYFSGNAGDNFVSYPAEVTGSVANTGTSDILTYNFNLLDTTEAAYVVFDSPISIPNDTNALKIDVTGDASNNWLRALLVDGNGNEHRIDFTKDLDFDDTRTLTATMPTNITYPVELTRVYITDANSDKYDNFTSSIELSNLVALTKLSTSDVSLPSSPKYYDPYNQDLSETLPTENQYDLIVLGDILNDNTTDEGYLESQAYLLDKLNNITNDRSYVVAGGDGQIQTGNIDKYYDTNYLFTNLPDMNATYSEITAANGGITNTNIWQWGSLFDNILASSYENAFIISDINPTNFTSSVDEELFTNSLENLVENGKNVFVISTEPSYAYHESINGVHYFNVSSGTLKENNMTDPLEYVQIRMQEDGNYYFMDNIE